jgi:hypothetical protein
MIWERPLRQFHSLDRAVEAAYRADDDIEMGCIAIDPSQKIPGIGLVCRWT